MTTQTKLSRTEGEEQLEREEHKDKTLSRTEGEEPKRKRGRPRKESKEVKPSDTVQTADPKSVHQLNDTSFRGLDVDSPRKTVFFTEFLGAEQKTRNCNVSDQVHHAFLAHQF